MVLPGQLGGRVGRRRDIFGRAALRGGSSRFLARLGASPGSLVAPCARAGALEPRGYALGRCRRPSAPVPAPSARPPSAGARACRATSWPSCGSGSARPGRTTRSPASSAPSQLLERGDAVGAAAEAREGEGARAPLAGRPRGARDGAVPARALPRRRSDGDPGVPADVGPGGSEPHHRGLSAGGRTAGARGARSRRRRSAARGVPLAAKAEAVIVAGERARRPRAASTRRSGSCGGSARATTSRVPRCCGSGT